MNLLVQRCCLCVWLNTFSWFLLSFYSDWNCKNKSEAKKEHKKRWRELKTESNGRKRKYILRTKCDGEATKKIICKRLNRLTWFLESATAVIVISIYDSMHQLWLRSVNLFCLTYFFLCIAGDVAPNRCDKFFFRSQDQKLNTRECDVRIPLTVARESETHANVLWIWSWRFRRKKTNKNPVPSFSVCFFPLWFFCFEFIKWKSRSCWFSDFIFTSLCRFRSLSGSMNWQKKFFFMIFSLVLCWFFNNCVLIVVSLWAFCSTNAAKTKNAQIKTR